MSTALTPALRDQHEQDEAIIAKGIATFREVGEALQRIRDSRTYLQTHENFEDYCRERWNLAKRYVNRIIEGAEIVKELGPIGPSITNEATARAVAKVEPSIRVEVVKKAVAHAESEGRDKITARDVERMSEQPVKAVNHSIRPSDGIQYARMAISQLEKIDRKDTERAAAFDLIQNYIDKNTAAR